MKQLLSFIIHPYDNSGFVESVYVMVDGDYNITSIDDYKNINDYPKERIPFIQEQINIYIRSKAKELLSG